MRKLEKTDAPPVLVENATVWTEEFRQDPSNRTKRFRYRHPEIKAAIRAECSNKCIFCESKLGHNTPGDVEHLTPSSVDPGRHFDWENLSLACTECNRRKGNYYDPTCQFLNPYSDKVEEMLRHHGPVVGWAPGATRAEVTVRRLELDSGKRKALLARKIETLEALNNLVERLASEESEALRAALLARLRQMMERSSEFSGMVSAICQGGPGLAEGVNADT